MMVQVHSKSIPRPVLIFMQVTFEVQMYGTASFWMVVQVQLLLEFPLQRILPCLLTFLMCSARIAHRFSVSFLSTLLICLLANFLR